MSDDADKRLTHTPLNAEQVASYLERHPTFLRERPELAAKLAAPMRDHEGSGDQTTGTVADFQAFQVSKLQAELTKMRRISERLITTSRANAETQAQIHRSVVALLNADTVDAAAHLIQHDLPALLHVEACLVAVETSDPLPTNWLESGFSTRLPGFTKSVMGTDKEIVLKSNVRDANILFGHKGDEIRSTAIVRLAPALSQGMPGGVAAFGSFKPEHFHPEQGTDLLIFLARVLEFCMRNWMSKVQS